MSSLPSHPFARSYTTFETMRTFWKAATAAVRSLDDCASEGAATASTRTDASEILLNMARIIAPAMTLSGGGRYRRLHKGGRYGTSGYVVRGAREGRQQAAAVLRRPVR